MSELLKKLFAKAQEESSNEGKKQKVRIEFDIEEHDYTVMDAEEETFDSYAYNGDCGVDNLEIYVDEVELSDEIVDNINERYTDYKKEILNWDDEVDKVASFGYFEATLHRLYEFETESFDFNKLEFLWNCYDVTFEEADYCVEEHRLTVLYDGVELENLMDDCCEGNWEEVWSRDEEDDEDCCDDEDENDESEGADVIKASKVFGILAYTAASLDDEVPEEEIKAILGIANAFQLDMDMVRQSVMLEKMGIRSYDSQSKLAASVPKEYHDKLFQGVIMVLIADFKIKQVELSFLSGLRDVWELSDEYAEDVLNFHVQRLIDSNPDREFEIEEDNENAADGIEEILNEKYDKVFKDGGVFCVQLNEKWGVVDANGNELISPRYDWMGDEFVEDVIIVCVSGDGIGYVNNEGIEIVAPKYSQARDFDNGFAAVYHGGKWGFIDKTGIEVIPTIYDDVNNFEDGKAEVTLNGETFFVDTEGQRIGAGTGTDADVSDSEITALDTDRLWADVISRLPEDIQVNVSAPSGRAYFFIKSKNGPEGADDFKYVVNYHVRASLCAVSVETLNGGTKGKKAIQKYIDNHSGDSSIKEITPQQGAKNKDKWAWVKSAPLAGKSYGTLVQWYVDTIVEFYRFFETV